MGFDGNKGERGQIAEEILTYLAENPRAQDTLEGIVQWWLLERDIKRHVLEVEEALSELVDHHWVLEWKGSDSRSHYKFNPEKAEEIRQSGE